MNFRKRMVGEVAVAVLSGALDGASALDVRDKLSKLLSQYEHVVVDFSGVSCVSSTSLRMLLLIYRQAQALGHTVAVLGLSPEVHNVLAATGFLDFFVVSDSITEAVASMRVRQEAVA
jgi:anti-sigma B factor antagonist